MDKALKKQLGLLDVYAICSGAMISSGLFLIPSMLSMAEMSTALPKAGGSYFFVSRSLGGMFGTIDGVRVWLALILKTSIALLGLGAYLTCRCS